MASSRFPDISRCESKNREEHSVVADMEGTLVISGSMFPYFALVAFDVGGVLRLLLLVLASPLAGLLHYFTSESAGIRVLIFATFAGTRVSDIESAARAVLPKFYSGDIHPEAWRVFSSCGGTRCVLAASPRIMVEPFLREYLGADLVVGTEISAWRGRATGLVASPGVVMGMNKADAVRKAFHATQPDIGIGDGEMDFPFLQLCKESYLVKRNEGAVRPVSPDTLLKRVVFHDGQLVQKPSPFMALVILLWIPIGFVLALLRIAAAVVLPMPALYYALWALGFRVTIKGTPPAQGQTGTLFVCSHRSVMDPFILCVALGRPIPAVTYSVSRLGEMISPIKTARLSRDRVKDARLMKKLLQEGDLIICPEGTTCREPFLLRFSALFAELSDEIVPVATACRMSMFHGTRARGWKGMDFVYFCMNPSPAYEVTLLNKLPYHLTCGGGKSSHEVANYVQRAIGAALSYECTGFTRKDKYRVLAGNDGNVVDRSSQRFESLRLMKAN